MNGKQGTKDNTQNQTFEIISSSSGLDSKSDYPHSEFESCDFKFANSTPQTKANVVAQVSHPLPFFLFKNRVDKIKMIKRMSSAVLFGMSSLNMTERESKIQQRPRSLLARGYHGARRNSQPMMPPQNYCFNNERRLSSQQDQALAKLATDQIIMGHQMKQYIENNNEHSESRSSMSQSSMFSQTVYQSALANMPMRRAASFRHIPVISGYVFSNTNKRIQNEKADIEKQLEQNSHEWKTKKNKFMFNSFNYKIVTAQSQGINKYMQMNSAEVKKESSGPEYKSSLKGQDLEFSDVSDSDLKEIMNVKKDTKKMMKRINTCEDFRANAGLRLLGIGHKTSLDIVDEVVTPVSRKKSQEYISPPKVLEEFQFLKLQKHVLVDQDDSSSN